MHNSTSDLDDLRSGLERLARLYDTAAAIQWEKSPARPTSRDDDAGRKGEGRVADPTSDVVLDDRRLQVRAEIRRADGFLRWARGAVATICSGLDIAILAWEGWDEPEVDHVRATDLPSRADNGAAEA